MPRRAACLLGFLVICAAATALALPAGAGAATTWLCKPGLRNNPCTPGLRTTVFSPTGRRVRVETPAATRNPKIDCFYVYPTVSGQSGPVANLRIDPEERSIALYQAARYSQRCRVFAPMYRQITLAGLFSGGVTAAMRARSYADVRDAWREYLRRYNHGRGVVLISHSQGTSVLRKLVASEIDPRPSERNRLVSAILLGGNVLVRRGSDVGGDFKHVRACHSRTQLGCVVAFSTFDAAVPSNSIFGRTTVAGQRVLCTNPVSLGGGSGLVDSILPSQPFTPQNPLAAAIKFLGLTLPTASTTWIRVPGGFRARCSSAGGANVLQITAVPGGQTPRASPDPTWGLHLLDANVALGNLVGLVQTEATAYLRRHPA